VPFALRVLEESLAITRLAGDAEVPDWAQVSEGFGSITRTRDELSIVCPDLAVPSGVTEERGWRALAVEGTLDLSQVGVLSELAGPLAAADIPIYVISTYDTDYILVPEESLAGAAGALETAGHSVAAPRGG
jgi:uncharacterized protein